MHPLTIQLSSQDQSLLEQEAQRQNLSPETLAQILIHNGINQVSHSSTASTTLEKLRQLTETMPSIDPVELVQQGRQQLAQRSHLA